VHHGVGRHWAENDETRKWIYIERDPLAIGVNRPIDAPLVGDLRDVIPQLLAELEATPRKRTAELDGLVKMHAQHKAQLAASAAAADATPVHPARFVFEATRAVPKDAVVTRDGGAVVIYSWAFSQGTPRDLVWNQTVRIPVNDRYLITSSPEVRNIVSKPSIRRISMINDTWILHLHRCWWLEIYIRRAKQRLKECLELEPLAHCKPLQASR
jgi:hypothetical protein